MDRANATVERLRAQVFPHSMVSVYRLLATAQLSHNCATSVGGDFVEAGVARGGASILMMAVLDEYNSSKRHFACDSFLGLPKGTDQDISSMNGCSRASREQSGARGCGYRGRSSHRSIKDHYQGLFKATYGEFVANVRRSRVSISRLVVVKGWFHQSLPPRALTAISFLRIDGDLYNSTREALNSLYPLVVPGGVVYVDDYGGYGGCRLAVDEYRDQHRITAAIHKIWERYRPYKRTRPGALYTTTHDQAGRGFEAVWWNKD